MCLHSLQMHSHVSINGSAASPDTWHVAVCLSIHRAPQPRRRVLVAKNTSHSTQTCPTSHSLHVLLLCCRWGGRSSSPRTLCQNTGSFGAVGGPLLYQSLSYTTGMFWGCVRALADFFLPTLLCPAGSAPRARGQPQELVFLAKKQAWSSGPFATWRWHNNQCTTDLLRSRVRTLLSPVTPKRCSFFAFQLPSSGSIHSNHDSNSGNARPGSGWRGILCCGHVAVLWRACAPAGKGSASRPSPRAWGPRHVTSFRLI
jgi:hypothetical protein